MRKSEAAKILKHQRRDLFIYLLGGNCVNCFSTEKLHFDHVIPETKLFNVSQKLECRLEMLLEEVQKCQLLCSSCHGCKTATDNPVRKPYNLKVKKQHGSYSMYTNGGCRCGLCLQARKDYHNIHKRSKINARGLTLWRTQNLSKN